MNNLQLQYIRLMESSNFKHAAWWVFYSRRWKMMAVYSMKVDNNHRHDMTTVKQLPDNYLIDAFIRQWNRQLTWSLVSCSLNYVCFIVTLLFSDYKRTLNTPVGLSWPFCAIDAKDRPGASQFTAIRAWTRKLSSSCSHVGNKFE